MRESIYNFRKGLLIGLRVHPQRMRQEECLVECFNLLPTEWGLVPYEEQTPHSIFGSLYFGEPFLFRGVEFDILCSGGSVYFTEPDVDQVVTVFNNDWDFVEFGGYWTLLNANVRIFGVGAPMFAVNEPTIDTTGNVLGVPLAKTGCNLRHRLILGNIGARGTHLASCDESSVVWSKIGSVECNPDLDNESGFIILKNMGAVHKIRPIEEAAVIYGENEIGALIPTERYFGYRKLADFGVAGFRAVAAGQDHHLFMDNKYRLWRMDKQLKLQFLDYQTWFDNSDVIMSYDPLRDWFYILNVTTERCFIYNGNGLSECYQLISNSIRSAVTNKIEVILYRAVTGNQTENEWLLETDTLSFESRGIKTAQMVEISGNFDKFPGKPPEPGIIPVYLEPATRMHFSAEREEFLRLPAKAFNDQGVCTYHVAGRDLRFRLRGSDFRAVLNIDDLVLHILYTDTRYTRGRVVNYK